MHNLCTFKRIPRIQGARWFSQSGVPCFQNPPDPRSPMVSRPVPFLRGPFPSVTLATLGFAWFRWVSCWLCTRGSADFDQASPFLAGIPVNTDTRHQERVGKRPGLFGMMLIAAGFIDLLVNCCVVHCASCKLQFILCQCSIWIHLEVRSEAQHGFADIKPERHRYLP